jgi:hypothetical protein
MDANVTGVHVPRGLRFGLPRHVKELTEFLKLRFGMLLVRNVNMLELSLTIDCIFHNCMFEMLHLSRIGLTDTIAQLVAVAQIRAQAHRVLSQNPLQLCTAV